MTQRDVDIVQFVGRYIAEHGGASPSFTEIANAIGLRSKSNVHRYVEKLVRDGRLIRQGVYRSLAVADPAPDLSRVPIAALRAEIRRREAVVA